MIDRYCRYCGFHFDASISYKGKPRRFGILRSWCTTQCRARNYYQRRRKRQLQLRIQQHYRHLEALGQLRLLPPED